MALCWPQLRWRIRKKAMRAPKGTASCQGTFERQEDVIKQKAGKTHPPDFEVSVGFG